MDDVTIKSLQVEIISKLQNKEMFKRWLSEQKVEALQTLYIKLNNLCNTLYGHQKCKVQLDILKQARNQALECATNQPKYSASDELMYYVKFSGDRIVRGASLMSSCFKSALPKTLDKSLGLPEYSQAQRDINAIVDEFDFFKAPLEEIVIDGVEKPIKLKDVSTQLHHSARKRPGKIETDLQKGRVAPKSIAPTNLIKTEYPAARSPKAEDSLRLIQRKKSRELSYFKRPEIDGIYFRSPLEPPFSPLSPLSSLPPLPEVMAATPSFELPAAPQNTPLSSLPDEELFPELSSAEMSMMMPKPFGVAKDPAAELDSLSDELPPLVTLSRSSSMNTQLSETSQEYPSPKARLDLSLIESVPTSILKGSEFEFSLTKAAQKDSAAKQLGSEEAEEQEKPLFTLKDELVSRVETVEMELPKVLQKPRKKSLEFFDKAILETAEISPLSRAEKSDSEDEMDAICKKALTKNSSVLTSGLFNKLGRSHSGEFHIDPTSSELSFS